VEQLINEEIRSEEKASEDNERRQQILEAARRLFSGRGYHGVSIRTIASEAGLKSPAHVYFYFENKADLYREALAQITAPMREISVSEAALDRPPERALASIARAYLRMFDDEETVQLYRMALMEAITAPRPRLASMRVISGAFCTRRSNSGPWYSIHCS
jgi:AcrR family transcriptional regulator